MQHRLPAADSARCRAPKEGPLAPRRIILDTDPAMGRLGGDPEDAFAILFALHSPELEVEAITIVQGNVAVEAGYANAVHLLGLAGRRGVPVHAGAAEPRPPVREGPRRWMEHRARLESIVPEAKPPPSAFDAVGTIVRAARARPGEITLVCIGPLTNVAAALEREPELPKLLAGVVAMAGAFRVPGNVTPAAEFNVWMDPEAASRVFEAGFRLKLVGLDVCERTRFEAATLATLAGAPSPLARFAAQATRPWLEIRRAIWGDEALHLYDSVAVAAVAHPEILRFEQAWVAVETEGRHTTGATVAHLNPILRAALTGREPNAEVALDLDVEAFDALFAERVLEPLLAACRADP